MVVKRFAGGSKPEIPVLEIFGSGQIAEGEIRLQNLPSRDHVLLTCAFRHDWWFVRGKEQEMHDIRMDRTRGRAGLAWCNEVFGGSNGLMSIK